MVKTEGNRERKRSIKRGRKLRGIKRYRRKGRSCNEEGKGGDRK